MFKAPARTQICAGQTGASRSLFVQQYCHTQKGGSRTLQAKSCGISRSISVEI
jgi:hypothetical protein